ncbi:hypothetical protein CAC42_3906 [Sphaceloma murrayae]|uniref:DUF676 domain-containing protein n=1 Tax=Sphaceloma murrayae TaxID=2082308 RepID=A0A2K1QS88_9PEZI|nr:hypothetical protein CAC42_3906 [Sphaceloma murrayae]
MKRAGHPPPPPAGPSRQSGTRNHDYQDISPPYSAFQVENNGKEELNIPYAGKDLRRRSTDSLRPPHPDEQRQRRKLILIYIHGFQGNERSFKSFPAHVHNIVTAMLSDSHVVHSKIYPRYRSKKHITIARDDFSRWLRPHESDKTDIVLFGHSMGGLLSAEVALMPAPDGRSLNHRLLGTINFDVPFLGMHPGVIKAGLSSIFAPSPDSPKEAADEGQFYLNSPSPSDSNVSTSQGINPPQNANPLQTTDPNFNPRFDNDVILPMRKGWKNAWHFVNKHSNNLLKDTKQAIRAHVEFAGGMADYNSLRARYARIRSLEVPDEAVRRSVVNESFTPPRMRFVNYYTASTGRPKPPKEESKDQPSKTSSSATSPNNKMESSAEPNTAPQGHLDCENQTLKPESAITSRAQSVPASPRISLNEHTADGIIEKDVEELNLDASPVEPRRDTPIITSHEGSSSIGENARTPSKEERNAMEAAVPQSRGRSPVRASDASGQSPIASLSSPHPSTAGDNGFQIGQESPDLSRYTTATSITSEGKPDEGASKKPKKDRKFCALPPKDSLGNRDPVWVRVFMKDVDEVTAHCGLFVESCPAYPSLVSDVAERVQEWAQDAESERVARELDAQYEY